jgi:hypothetical protein
LNMIAMIPVIIAINVLISIPFIKYSTLHDKILLNNFYFTTKSYYPPQLNLQTQNNTQLNLTD